MLKTYQNRTMVRSIFFLSSISSMIFAKSEKNERANERQLLLLLSQRRTGKERKKNFMRHV